MWVCPATGSLDIVGIVHIVDIVDVGYFWLDIVVWCGFGYIL